MAESSEAITGKFDFYDILGYLIPGLVFLGLLSLPFGLIKGSWPSTSLTSAVLYLVVAHILGHILQGLLRAWESVPQIRDKKENENEQGEWRNPSSVLLDANQKSLAPFRSKIGELVEKFWKIRASDLLADNHDSERDAAFLQVRNLLLQSKKQSYVEQFQGKYALMGGMAATLLIVSWYYAGWVVALFHSERISSWAGCALKVFWIFLSICVVSLIIIYRLDMGSRFFGKKRDISRGTSRMIFRIFLLVLLGIGTALGGFVVANAFPEASETHKSCEAQKETCTVGYVGNSEGCNEAKSAPALHIKHKSTFVLVLGLAAFGAAVRCYGAYKAFAREFALGVWRDFANFDLLTGSENKA